MKLPKSKSISAINYYIITNDSNINYIHIPMEYFEAFDLLRKFPKDIFQISESLEYYQYQITNKLFEGLDVYMGTYDLLVENEANQLLNKHLNLFSARGNIKVFILNGEEKEENITKVIKQINNINGIKYIISFNDPSINVRKHCEDIYINNIQDFLNRINTDKENILKEYPENYRALDLKATIEEDLKDINNFPYFMPCASNFFTLNQIVNNYWVNDKIPKSEIVSKEDYNAHLNKRWELILQTVDKIDNFIDSLYYQESIKRVSVIDPYFETIILVFPFQNPDYKYHISKSVKNGLLKKVLLSIEQGLDFVSRPNLNIPDDISETELNNILSVVIKKEKDRSLFLDCVAYLHASFSYSPIIRFPQIGRTIYGNLSYLNPDNMNPKRSKPLKTILRYGKSLKKRTMPNVVSENLKTKNRQIFAISDLPVEWLIIDEVPLCFSHDVCRLPESNYRSLTNNYIANQRFRHTVSENILSKTLVIFGASTEIGKDEQFKAWYPQVISDSKKLGFKFAHCKTKEEVVEIVKHIKPELLIFDCHGEYDRKTKSSFLWIGNEKLTGEYIIENIIYAPLIFLSACNTSPNYGFIKLIAEAFFQTGSTSVTSTFLPIGINEGSILYIRLLNRLATASKQAIHANWLSFISHIIRTSVIQESFLKPITKYSKEAEEKLISMLNDSMLFSERRNVYKKLKLDNLSNEFLFYSNLGRSDLILFESWIKERKRINGYK